MFKWKVKLIFISRIISIIYGSSLFIYIINSFKETIFIYNIEYNFDHLSNFNEHRNKNSFNYSRIALDTLFLNFFNEFLNGYIYKTIKEFSYIMKVNWCKIQCILISNENIIEFSNLQMICTMKNNKKVEVK